MRVVSGCLRGGVSLKLPAWRGEGGLPAQQNWRGKLQDNWCELVEPTEVAGVKGDNHVHPIGQIRCHEHRIQQPISSDFVITKEIEKTVTRGFTGIHDRYLAGPPPPRCSAQRFLHGERTLEPPWVSHHMTELGEYLSGNRKALSLTFSGETS